MLGEVPAMVDFLFVDEPVIEASWAWEAVATDDSAPAVLDAALAAYQDCDVDGGRPAPRHPGDRRTAWAASSTRPRPRSGWR